jgi:hypothetical protein
VLQAGIKQCVAETVLNELATLATAVSASAGRAQCSRKPYLRNCFTLATAYKALALAAVPSVPVTVLEIPVGGGEAELLRQSSWC